MKKDILDELKSLYIEMRIKKALKKRLIEILKIPAKFEARPGDPDNTGKVLYKVLREVKLLKEEL